MSRVFVTGATGVLGRRVVPRLLAAGHVVTAVARSAGKAARLRELGAEPVDVDLFDADAVARAVVGHDVVAHLATNIPTGAAAATKRGWRTNDRLRRDVAGELSRACTAADVGRYVQESITFPYVDCGDRWIDEETDRTYFWGNATTADAEAAASTVTEAGGSGVVLRFAMFIADDSAHMKTFAAMARRGVWGLFGDDDAHVSFVHVDDAAAAVVAALDAPAGVYNVAEAEPLRRADHRARLASAAGRRHLRPLPGLVERAGGAGAESLARSHRISSASMSAATGWRPARVPVEIWKEIA